jgi:PHD/YefM family antitoxin component YafN of YafNO toxin-antitoxin module
VNADHEPVIITRDRGKPAAVLMHGTEVRLTRILA